MQEFGVATTNLSPLGLHGLHGAEAGRWIKRLLQQGEASVNGGVLGEFEVRRIAIEELRDLDTYVVGIAENEDGSGESLLFQTAITAAEEQDRALGMDTYCVSTAWGATVYGGVMACALRDDLLTLKFDPPAAETLGISQECRFRLRVDQDRIEQLKQGLRTVLSTGHPPIHVQL